MDPAQPTQDSQTAREKYRIQGSVRRLFYFWFIANCTLLPLMMHRYFRVGMAVTGAVCSFFSLTIIESLFLRAGRKIALSLYAVPVVAALLVYIIQRK